MTKTLFEQCVEIILRNEGGYVNDPDDKGGETKYGISDRADGHIDGMVDIDRDGKGDVEVEKITTEQAKQIYLNKYWKPLNLEGIEDMNAALQIFDFAVNAGISRAIKTAQRLCGSYVDGKIGPDTVAKINNLGHCFLLRYIHARKEYYCYLADKNPVNKKYLNGWLSRVEDTKLIII